MSEEILVSVDSVGKKFCRSLRKSLWYGVQDIGREMIGRSNVRQKLRPEEFWALRDISFELRRGESLGLIGRNGAGKSTLLRLLNGLIKPDEGYISIKGKVGAIIALGAGFNPVLTGRENIYVNAAVLGLHKKHVDLIIDEIIEFAEIGDFIDTPIQSYSSGMQVRLGFSVAAHLNPDILLVDEVLAVGDVGFQRKCLQRMKKYVNNGGTLIFVSHHMHMIQSMCSKCLLVNSGSIELLGNTPKVVSRYYDLFYSVDEEIDSGSDQDVPDEDSPIAIEKLIIESTSGELIYVGSSIEVTLQYHSIKDFDDVVWDFSIWTRDRTTRITTIRSRFADLRYNVIRGRGEYRCTIPKLNLIPGVYALRAGIYDPETSWAYVRAGFENDPVFFTVSTSGNEMDNWGVADQDLLAVDNPKWG